MIISTPLLGLALLLGGLVVCWLSASAKYPLLVKVVLIIGIVLVVIGCVLLITPVIVWVDGQLRAMLGHG